MNKKTVDHNLSSVVQESVNPINESAEVKEKISRLMITPNYDLRGLQPKIDTLKSTPLCTGWMVFLNKKGSLAHIIHKDDIEEETYIRMKVPCRFHGADYRFMQRYFFNRMVKRYII
jgi:hypothetical protein